MLKLNKQQEKLFEFVSFHHKDQLRKYTNKPYIEHCLSVAEMVSHLQYFPICFVEIALCHDLVEDTKCTLEELRIKLNDIGYDEIKVDNICKGVSQLTNVHTKEKYPNLNRHERKLRDAKIEISPSNQTIKYADIIDNLSSIAEYDINFAKVYVKEKIMFIDHNRLGESYLLIKCCYEIQKTLNIIDENKKLK